jgi:hypothetical protein
MIHENLKLIGRLRAMSSRHGRSPGETAIARTLRYPEVIGAPQFQASGRNHRRNGFWAYALRNLRGRGPKKRNDFGELLLYSFLATEIPARSIETAPRP